MQKLKKKKKKIHRRQQSAGMPYAQKALANPTQAKATILSVFIQTSMISKLQIFQHYTSSMHSKRGPSQPVA